ncbi:MAG: peptide chain release factor-like protein [bacterium]|nr:peptide chain release factor-like protein [bacterium]
MEDAERIPPEDCSDSPAVRWLLLDDAALLAQCKVDLYRASGPGGQKRNKTDSAVRLRHASSGLSVVATESRSQHENKAKALRRLRQAVALSVRAPVDAPAYTMSPLLGRCITAGGRLHVGRRDHRYPFVVAEVLDVLAACEVKVSRAAELLGVSTAHLGSFFAKDPGLWTRVNQMRGAAGLKPLR